MIAVAMAEGRNTDACRRQGSCSARRDPIRTCIEVAPRDARVGPHGGRACPLSARAPGGHSECAGTHVRGTPGDRASVPVGSGPGRRGNLET